MATSYRQRALDNISKRYQQDNEAKSITTSYRQRALNPTSKPKEQEQPTINVSDIPKIDINAIAEQSRGGITSAQIRQQANLMQQEKQRIEQEQKAKEQAKWQAKTPIQKVGTVVGKTLATPVATIGELGTGVARGFEGFLDAGITLGGVGIGAMRKRRLENSQKTLDKLVAEGKINQKEAQEWQQRIDEEKIDDQAIDKTTTDIIEYPIAEKLLGKANREFSQNYSYLPTKAADVSKTVGTMLPSVAVGNELMATKPLQALANTGKVGTKVASTVSMTPFMAQAAGMSTEEALRDGADLNSAAKYGALSGAVEGAIEAISGGIGGTAGNKIISKLAPATIAKISNKVIAKYLPKFLDAGIDLLGEGGEEWLSAYINPYIKRLTYDEKAELSTSEERMEAFVDGMLASFLLKGATSLVERTTPQGEVEALPEMDIATQNQLKSLGIQETNVPNVTQNVSKQQTNVTLPNQTEMAQKANTEQIDTKRIPGQYFANNKVVYNNDGTVNRIKTGENIFENNEGKSIEKTIKDYLKKHINEYSSIIESGQKVYLGEDLPGEYVYSKNARNLSTRELLAKGRAATGIKEIIENANNRSWSKNLKEKHEEDAKYGFYTYDTTFSFDQNGKEKVYTGKVLIRNDADGKKYLYDILDIKPKKIDNVFAAEASNSKSSAINGSSNSSSINSISQNDNFVKSTYVSPVSDIEKANDFVSKATVNDIETLQKMVEEAEKHLDRIDLQFFAEKARETIEKLSRQQVRQAIMEETGLENYNLDDINKISKAKMNFTTPIRVIEKIFNKETANKINENFFKPIKHNEAERIRRLNKERNDIKELEIKPGSAEDAAIQKYGEGEYVDNSGIVIPYTLDNLKRDFPETWQKLQKATNVIRNKYDTYLEEINKVLQDNGYDPIPKRKDYFRHFEELNDLFSVLGVPTKVDDIPTDLAGMTADLKPGKQFFANALQRKGKRTTYSAIKGIDGYLDGAMNILYHTKDIQKLRTLDKYIRDTYGQEKGLSDANTMTEEQKAQRIQQVNEGHLSEFAAWLTEYTNALAGKKSQLDRGIESLFSRKVYKYLNLIKKQVGANMTGLNVNSALSNFISVTQAAPKTNKKALAKGTIDTVKNIFNKDDFINKSDFLTTRFGSDKLAKNWWQKAGDAGQIFMSGTDYFTANLITRSKYQEFLDKGYTEAEAIKKADEFADRIMAGRGKGDLPTAFESKMFGIVTQFQLEVTNQLDSIFYDTLHEDYAAESTSKLAKEHPKFYNAASATFILGQLFALAFLYNEGKEKLTGTEGGALDPIGTIVDAIKYYTDDNLTTAEATAKVIEDIANQLPFLSIFTGGGRLPIKEALPDLLSVLKGEAKMGDEMWNLTNLLLPTGGGQLKKTAQGLSTFAKGGSYSKDAEGNEKLKYPVEKNVGNFVKSALFGKWSTEGAKRYIDSGFKSLSANQTEGYQKAKKAGISDEQFYNAYNAQKKVDNLDDLTSLVKKNEIDKATRGLSQTKRKILYEIFGVAKGEWDNTRNVYPLEIKAKKEELAREKLKKKEK